MYWEEPKDINENFSTAESYRIERNVKNAIEEGLSALGSIEAHLSTFSHGVGVASRAAHALEQMADMMLPDAEGQTVLARAYAAMIVKEHERTLTALRVALSGVSGAEGNEGRELRVLIESLKSILGDG